MRDKEVFFSLGGFSMMLMLIYDFLFGTQKDSQASREKTKVHVWRDEYRSTGDTTPKAKEKRRQTRMKIQTTSSTSF
jgi:hypothetical protein